MGDVKISVLTPTIRKEGLKTNLLALENQMCEESFEWLIGAPFDPEIPEQEFPVTWIEDDFENGFWTLNRIYNRLFEHAKGELLIMLQDYIWVPPDGLQKFWDAYMETGGQACISGVGDQYEKLDEHGKPIVNIWSDPRRTLKNNMGKYGSFYECNWNDCEWNWAAVPKVKILQAGGMDEQLDFLGFGGDQLQACDRMSDMGVKFILDQANESYTFRHTREASGGQLYWDENHVMFNGKYVERKNELIRKGHWPVLTK